jgi:uncharacterized protein (DUF58 family)
VTLRRNSRGADNQRADVPRSDTRFATGTEGLTNARTRIVGNRTGVVADSVVASVRVLTAARDAIVFWARRAAAVVTPLGWGMLVAVFVGLGGGYAFSWVEFISGGYAVLVLVLVALIYLVGRSALAIELAVANNRVVVGETAIGTVTVRNTGVRRSTSVTVEVPVGTGLAEIVLPGVARAGSATREFAVPTARRGLVAVGPARTVRADPIGLVRRELVWTGATELFVHPRTIEMPSMSSGFVRDLEGAPTRDLTNNDIAFHALREYVPGDDRRTIHWKSTAKTGTFMVRQFEQSRRSHIAIALSLATADYASDDEFEMAVSVTGSLGVRAIRDSRDVSVVVSEKTPEFAKRKLFAISRLSTVTRERLLDDLAVVEHAVNALSILDIARVAGIHVAGVSVAFLVCGSSTSVRDIRAASTKFPVGVEVVAVVCQPNSAPILRRAPGLSILTIGLVEDLRKSIERVATS